MKIRNWDIQNRYRRNEWLMSSTRPPMTMTTWVPTAYRTHTLGEIQSKGADLIDQEVTVSGFMEANRGKGKFL